MKYHLRLFKCEIEKRAEKIKGLEAVGSKSLPACMAIVEEEEAVTIWVVGKVTRGDSSRMYGGAHISREVWCPLVLIQL